MPAPRVLIVKTSSMGDVIHALPLVSDLARALPGAQIDWVVEDSFAAIPALHPAVSQVFPVALRKWRRALLKRETWRQIGDVRARMRAQRYDHIIDCQGLIKSAWVARWALGPITGPDRASAREALAAAFYTQPVAVPRSLHAIERNRALGAAALGYAITTPADFGLARVAATASTPYAVLLTNASRPTKLWPDERWAEVAAWLAARGLPCKLFWGSEEEGERTRARAARMAAAEVMPRCSLNDVAQALAGASVVIGLDTGLSHLAAALGVPTVGIFCDYDPALVGLMGRATVNLGGVDQAPPTAAVIEAAERLLAAPAHA